MPTSELEIAPQPVLSVDLARQEIKFVAPDSQLDGIRHYLKICDAGFKRHHPDRVVNNVYYDNYQYFAFAENLSGVSERNKLRYRWYGDSSLPQAGALELKCKRNHLGWKFNNNVAALPARPGITWREINRHIRQQVPRIARQWMDFSPQTVLINRYYRRYFISADGRIRATIDTQQAVYEQRNNTRPNTRRPINHPALLILEFKFSEQDRQQVSRLLGDVPVRRSRHSKYVVGLLALNNH